GRTTTPLTSRSATRSSRSSPSWSARRGLTGTSWPAREALQVVRRLTEATVPGSYLVISHPTTEVDATPMTEAVRFWNEQGSAQMTLRSREQLARFFDGMELLEPGLVTCSRWRPEVIEIGEIVDVTHFGGVARKLRQRVAGPVTGAPA